MEFSLVGKIWDDRQTVFPDRLGFSRHMKIGLDQSRIERTQESETDTVLPILLCKTNLDISSLPELAKVKVKRIFRTLCEKMHHGRKQKVPSESSARN